MAYPVIDWGDRADEIDPLVLARVTKLAWAAYSSLTLQDFDAEERQLRPTRRPPVFGSYTEAPVAAYGFGVYGAWVVPFLHGSVGHQLSCACAGANEILLTGVSSVIEVAVDGEVLSPQAWRFDKNYLYRLDGKAWPSSQNLALFTTEPDTFGITVTAGVPVDDLDLYAVELLAAEFLLAANNDSSCRLPTNVTAITRQGVSYEMTVGLFTDGTTGIPEVDVIVQRWNPHLLRSRSRVFNPNEGSSEPRWHFR